MATDLTDLQTERDRLTLERESAQLRLEVRQLTEAAEAPQVVLTEDFGSIVDRNQFLYDDPSFNFGSAAMPISRLDDRLDGRYRPFYETEQDLMFMRGAAHVITAVCGSAVNILVNLTSYTIADGFHHEIQAVKGQEPPQGLVEACQHVIDTFQGENNWKADLESEIHWRSREDGEAAIALKPLGWRTRATIIEPDQITQPRSPFELEQFLADAGASIRAEQAQDFVASWTYGVHTRHNDCSRALGYHVVADASGLDWQYYPSGDVRLAKRIGGGVLELIKRNVPRNVKRGISDFYPVVKRLERKEKLARNTEDGGAIQAAIALIRKHVPTTTNDQIAKMRANSATDVYTQKLGNGSTRQQLKQNWKSGTVVDYGNIDLMYGPMGQSGAPNFIAIIQAALRDVGARWVMPEYMVSGDASNAALASTLVVGSPFVKARQADQFFYESRFVRIDWLVLRIAFEGGFFERFGLAWDQIERLIVPIVTAPDITIADDLKAAQVKEIEARNNVLSAKTWMKETGRDTDEEEKNLAEEAAKKRANMPPQLAGQPAGAPTSDKVPSDRLSVNPRLSSGDGDGGGEEGSAGVTESLADAPGNPWEWKDWP